ncbi:MAG: NAD-dependent dehydratase [Alphaproteobacteria bacterium]|nr:NAD-dependent dehydratase [Alphaproteobacteria bacterium]|tara:strand:- start:3557 stop:4612 length:1056 start_codon:yes stop_codon:yes gene_type:complete
MTDRKVALVFGASGIIGRGFLRHLDGLNDWDIIGVMRNLPNFDTRAEHLAVDLTNRDECLAGLNNVPHVTHAFYTAYKDFPTWEAAAEPNTEMFENAMDGLLANAPNLEHIQILQGAKYYGRHLGPYKTPSREDDPRHMPPSLYFGQEDYLREIQSGQPWSWSAVRPQAVCGLSIGNPLNLTSVLAVYAVISRELGLPLRWPGKPEAFHTIYQVTDYEILGKSMVWAATTPDCANEAFNITNGDVFRWDYMWEHVAGYFGMEVGPPQQINLAMMMADKEPLWNEIVEKFDLAPTPFDKVANWSFGDYAFASDWDVCMDTTKSRKAGFLDFIDTKDMFLQQFDELRDAKIIP